MSRPGRATGPGAVSIQLRLRDLAQLFNSMAPSPFHERDLDADAEDFIVSWAREHPKDHEFQLEIHLSEVPRPERRRAWRRRCGIVSASARSPSSANFAS